MSTRPNSRFTPAIIPSVLGPGDNVVTGTLVFEKAGTAEVEYEVMGPNAGMAQ